MLKTLPSTKIPLLTSLVGDTHVWDRPGGLRQPCCQTPFCEEPSHHKQWILRTQDDPWDLFFPLYRSCCQCSESPTYLLAADSGDHQLRTLIDRKQNMASQHGPGDWVWISQCSPGEHCGSSPRLICEIPRNPHRSRSTWTTSEIDWRRICELQGFGERQQF